MQQALWSARRVSNIVGYILNIFKPLASTAVGRRNAWQLKPHPGSGCYVRCSSTELQQCPTWLQKASLAGNPRWLAYDDMSTSSGDGQAQSSSASQSSDDILGEVQDILAERFSSTLGCSEVLVTWKPEWIPIANLQDGPILRKYRAATKCRFMSAAGQLILPVMPNTALADDMDAAAARAGRQPELQPQFERGTPRKSLGSVAKRPAPSAHTDRASRD